MEEISSIIDKWLDPAFKTLKEHPDMHTWLRDMSTAVCQEMIKLNPSSSDCAKVYAARGAEFFDSNFEAVESQIRSFDPEYAHACKEGCTYCCHSHVSATPQEVFLIADVMREILEDGEMEVLRQEIKGCTEGYSEEGYKKFALDYLKPCPFLNQNICVIYDIRPLACRNWISQDVAACKASYNSGNKQPVPQNAVLMHQKDVIIAGEAAALSQFGINGSLCSMLPALDSILDDYEGSYKKWLSGELLYGQLDD